MLGTPRAGASDAAGGGQEAQAIATPLASFRLQGHTPFIDSVPKLPEPLSALPSGSTHADLVVRALPLPLPLPLLLPLPLTLLLPLPLSLPLRLSLPLPLPLT